jgi:hypothetical protein
MSAVCPSGHRSQTPDYCDQCGARIFGGKLDAGLTAELAVVEEIDTSPAIRREPCPACAAERSGNDRYCEGCGYDFLGPPPTASDWEAVVTADRAQFDRLAAAGVSFPTNYVERRYALADGENRIGRSRGHPGETAPEIDLAASPADPGISRLHAVIERRSDGVYLLRDLGSTNGTTVNDDLVPIAPETAVALGDGDRIRLGAWTTITLRRR